MRIMTHVAPLVLALSCAMCVGAVAEGSFRIFNAPSKKHVEQPRVGQKVNHVVLPEATNLLSGMPKRPLMSHLALPIPLMAITAPSKIRSSDLKLSRIKKRGNLQPIIKKVPLRPDRLVQKVNRLAPLALSSARLFMADASKEKPSGNAIRSIDVQGLRLFKDAGTKR